MTFYSKNLRESVVRYCSRIGSDPMLVQGAGGNVSWKDGDTLYIKASGTWLEDAGTQDIFVAVDLTELHSAIAREDFSVTPALTKPSQWKPSIETLLHALMPHTVVAHLHAIEVLSHLVRFDCEETLHVALGDIPSWITVDYQKPGADLAQAVSAALTSKPDANLIFLKKHGVVIGGANIEEVHRILTEIVAKLSLLQYTTVVPKRVASRVAQYHQVEDEALQQLAFDAHFFGRLQTDWVLYPDHVVFLGPKACVYDSWEALQDALEKEALPPELVFVRNEGVFATLSFTRAKTVQLRCYYDVLARQQPETRLAPLTFDQIGELLNWDAEQYRMRIAKK